MKHNHDTITFNGSKGVWPEICQFCNRSKWLGTCNDGCRMCQSCYTLMWGGDPLPSDSMTIVKEEKPLKDQIFKLIQKIWGRDKTSKGFNWVAAKFGNKHNDGPDEVLRTIVLCLTSKKEQSECPIHGRIHDAKTK